MRRGCLVWCYRHGVCSGALRAAPTRIRLAVRGAVGSVVGRRCSESEVLAFLPRVQSPNRVLARLVETNRVGRLAVAVPTRRRDVVRFASTLGRRGEKCGRQRAEADVAARAARFVINGNDAHEVTEAKPCICFPSQLFFY